MQNGIDQAKKVRYLQITSAVLAVLLVISIVALAVVMSDRGDVSKSKDNVIDPNNTDAEISAGEVQRPQFVMLASSSETEDFKLTWFSRDEQKEIILNNMLPGDSESRQYEVTVKYKKAESIYMGVTVTEATGTYKLSDVLKLKVEASVNGAAKTTLYDGLMVNLGPDGNNVGLNLPDTDSDRTVTYTLTVYLDRTVGNSYQNKTLTAEFSWWIEKEEVITETTEETTEEITETTEETTEEPTETTEETTEEPTETTEETTEEPTETTEETTEEPTETTEETTEEITETTEEPTEEITETTEETTEEPTETTEETTEEPTETTEETTEEPTETETETETEPEEPWCEKPETCIWPWLHDIGVKYPACHVIPLSIPGGATATLIAGWVLLTVWKKREKRWKK